MFDVKTEIAVACSRNGAARALVVGREVLIDSLCELFRSLGHSRDVGRKLIFEGLPALELLPNAVEDVRTSLFKTVFYDPHVVVA